MVSASHNPPHDNGIKVFGSSGAKLDRTTQQAIEAGLRGDAEAVVLVAEGTAHPRADLLEGYAATLIASGTLNVDFNRRHRSRCSLNRSITSEALWPPKPKPFDSAISVVCSRITFGT